MTALLTYATTILIFVAVLAVLVLAHEFGHYLAARLFKMDVEEFGFGFPPRLFGWKRKGTIWSVNWIPLGGFVKIKGENKTDLKEPGSFASKPVYARATVVAAGVIMNLLLATVLFTGAFAIGVPQLIEDLPGGIRDQRVQILAVLPGSAAEEAGLHLGDIIEKVDGVRYGTITEVQDKVNASPDGAAFLIRRGSEEFTKTIEPRLNKISGRRVIGVELAETSIIAYPLHVAAWKGLQATGFYLKEIALTLVDLVASLFAGPKPAVELSGPVGIAVLTGRVAKLGLASLLQFMGLLSVNLAFVNFLPVPALDGGRFVIILVEKLRRRALRPKVEEWMYRISFGLLLLVVLAVTAQDFGRYGGKLLDALRAILGLS